MSWSLATATSTTRTVGQSSPAREQAKQSGISADLVLRLVCDVVFVRFRHRHKVLATLEVAHGGLGQLRKILNQ